jgi:hypothetical protein
LDKPEPDLGTDVDDVGRDTARAIYDANDAGEPGTDAAADVAAGDDSDVGTDNTGLGYVEGFGME